MQLLAMELCEGQEDSLPDVHEQGGMDRAKLVRGMGVIKLGQASIMLLCLDGVASFLTLVVSIGQIGTSGDSSCDSMRELAPPPLTCHLHMSNDVCSFFVETLTSKYSRLYSPCVYFFA